MAYPDSSNKITPDIDIILAQPLLARLATTNCKTLQPHLTLVWFLWDGESIWISAFSSTRKIKEIQGNPKIAVLIEPKSTEYKLQAVLLEGSAELITDQREMVKEMSLKIYEHYLGPEGVLAEDPQSWARDAENRLIKLTPERVFSW